VTSERLDAPRVLAGLVDDAARARSAPAAVGIAGGVAAGKSTLAADLAAALERAGRAVELVSTDGFLLPNSVLAGRGLVARKGFPETYDVDGLRALVAAVRTGQPNLTVPVYSHVTYDIVPGEVRVLARADVVIVEGVNALSALAGSLDLAVYVHADEADLESWYVRRFLELVLAAHDDPASFYRMFAGMTEAEADAMARRVWRDVNLVNLREHIGPSRAHADCVVMKGADHTVTAIEVREHG
jgi:type I pantothenate kinase